MSVEITGNRFDRKSTTTAESAEFAESSITYSEREILRLAKLIRARRADERLTARMEHHAKLASVAMPTRKYPIVLCDPPWRFAVRSERGSWRTADAHYPTLTVEQIAALAVPAAESSVLFLWTTVPILPRALEVMTAWGFTYKSSIVWVKDRIGTGYWVRNKHEFLLIGTKGAIPAPAPSARPESVIVAPIREHSRKPDEVYALIERVYPTLPKIELFARTRRDGWAAWGNETPGGFPRRT